MHQRKRRCLAAVNACARHAALKWRSFRNGFGQLFLPPCLGRCTPWPVTSPRKRSQARHPWSLIFASENGSRPLSGRLRGSEAGTKSSDISQFNTLVGLKLFLAAGRERVRYVCINFDDSFISFFAVKTKRRFFIDCVLLTTSLSNTNNIYCDALWYPRYRKLLPHSESSVITR